MLQRGIFRGHQGADCSRELSIITDAKVTDLVEADTVLQGCDQDITGLNVPVRDILLMKVVDGEAYLEKDLKYFLFAIKFILAVLFIEFILEAALSNFRD